LAPLSPKEFAAEGAHVFLAGRTQSSIEDVARRIAAAGGRAQASTVNALDDAAVTEYIDCIVKQTGRIDAVFNAIGPLAREYGNGKYAVDLKIEEFMVPLTTVVKSQFITARAAARHMVQQHSGVIILLTGSPARGHVQGATASVRRSVQSSLLPRILRLRSVLLGSGSCAFARPQTRIAAPSGTQWKSWRGR
jgi:3-oxoacyl-[acyl-carrier protein] reductase